MISWYPVIAVLNTTSPTEYESIPIDLPENVVPSSSISIASFKFLPSLPTFGSKKGKDFMSPSLEKFGIKTILGSNQSDVIKKLLFIHLCV